MAIRGIHLSTRSNKVTNMLRVQAFITSQTGCKYTVKAHAEGVDTPFIFNIDANSDKDAAMEAIRRVEAMDSLITQSARAI
jgi:hypothetical protein